MGVFTSTAKFFVYLLCTIFSLAGLVLLGMGLYLRFDDTQWAYLQTEANGARAVYTYIGLGAALFVFSFLGLYGAGKPKRRFSLFLFQFGTLVCLAVSIYGAVILFNSLPSDMTVKQQQDIQATNDAAGTFLTAHNLDAIHQYQRPFAIFLACVAGAEGLLFLCSIILCFQKPEGPALPQYGQHHTPPQNQRQAGAVVGGQPVQFA